MVHHPDPAILVGSRNEVNRRPSVGMIQRVAKTRIVR
jgi:hypothetical protein